MFPVIAVGAAVIGLAFLAKEIGGAISDRRKHAAAETQAREAVRALRGWSFDEVAMELAADYDQDSDDRIVWNAVQGVRMLGESVITTARTWSEPAPSALQAPRGTRIVRERETTRSLEPLLRASDTDGDGVVTRRELRRAVRKFDANDDRRLSAAARERALAAYSDVLVSDETRTIGVTTPPPPQPAPKSAPPTAPPTAPAPNLGGAAPATPADTATAGPPVPTART